MSESSNMLASEINALPDHVRRYVHDLETRCDPAGDTVTIFALRENCAGLELLLQRARATIRELEAALDNAEERSKACDQIAEGDYGWENIFPLCVATMSVCRLRSDYERLRSELLECQSFIENGKATDHDASVLLVQRSTAKWVLDRIRDALRPPVATESSNG